LDGAAFYNNILFHFGEVVGWITVMDVAAFYKII
jgi:hypothetical protein